MLVATDLVECNTVYERIRVAQVLDQAQEYDVEFRFARDTGVVSMPWLCFRRRP